MTYHTQNRFIRITWRTAVGISLLGCFKTPNDLGMVDDSKAKVVVP